MPKVITQTRLQQKHVEQIVEVPVPMTEEPRGIAGGLGP